MDWFDFELTETKWSLLKQLEKGPLSPKELADLTKTSVANASQQLRFLEAQGFLKKIRKNGVSARQDRDARILYSIAKQKIWITKISGDQVDRKELRNADSFLLNLFLCDLKEIRSVLKFFLDREDLFKKIQCIYYLQSINNEVHFFVVTDDLDFFRKDNHSFEVLHHDKKTIIKFWSHSFTELEQGLANNELYFVDLAKRVVPLRCDNEHVKNLLRVWK